MLKQRRRKTCHTRDITCNPGKIKTCVSDKNTVNDIKSISLAELLLYNYTIVYNYTIAYNYTIVIQIKLLYCKNNVNEIKCPKPSGQSFRPPHKHTHTPHQKGMPK